VSRIFFSTLLAGAILPAASQAQPPERELDLTERENERRMAEMLPTVRAALQGNSIEAQRAALQVITSISSIDSSYSARANFGELISTYLQREHPDTELIVMAIKAYGLSVPPADVAKKTLAPFATSPQAEIRQAVAVASTSLINNAFVAAFEAMTRLNPLVGRDSNYFANTTLGVLPFLGASLSDADSKTKQAGAEGFRTIARLLADTSRNSTRLNLSEFLPAEKVEEKRKALEPLIKAIAEYIPHFVNLLKSPLVADRQAGLAAVEKLASLRRSLADSVIGRPLDESFLKLAPTLLTLKSDSDPQIRLALVESVEPLDRAVLPRNLLIETSNDPNLFVRWAAVRSLGMHAPKEADSDLPTEIATLARVLSDTDVDVRMSASSALARYGSLGKPATPELVKMAKNGDVEPRVSAIKTLTQVKADADQAVPPMILALQHDDVRLQKAAAVGLKDYGPAAKEALPGLRQALKSDDSELRAAAAAAIFAIELPPPPKKPREI
jgi:HEAT repeat protein